ncbi:MAG: NADH-quinone oxidoreductase subunit NuoG [Bacteroidales bacterium]
MALITIDGIQYEANPGVSLLEACLTLGFNVPHFCYHPAMGSVGACRLCAVKKYKNADDKAGRIVMSCMEPVVEGLIISLEDPQVKLFRKSVSESLMMNHPHDCPVCDEGGECHLQDMTIMTDHNYRRFDFRKRTFTNQDLGPFINHEMNRCIECYRCVRFYRDYAMGRDLSVFSAHDYVYFGRHKDGMLQSEFSGNLVEVCPTGVFTDKTLKNHYSRKWDMTNAPSVCVHCSVGCNTLAGERYDYLRRIRTRYNGQVNGYFICDRGRFGYEFVNDSRRIRHASVRTEKSGSLSETGEAGLSGALQTALSGIMVIGIGSPRASVESNFALSKFVGKENFYHGIPKKEHLLTREILSFYTNTRAHIPSLKEIEKADAVLILGEDLTNAAPMMALAVRQAIRTVPNREAVREGIPLWNDHPVRELAQTTKSPVFIATSVADPLDDIAELSFRGTPGEIAMLGFAVASGINSRSPAPVVRDEKLKSYAERIAGVLSKAERPLIIGGTTCCDEEILYSSMNVVNALLNVNQGVMATMVVPECNSLGLAMLPGNSFEELFMPGKETDTLIVLENDLYRRADKAAIDNLLTNTKKVIVLDHLLNETASAADILLPAATFAGSEGTLVSNEGRAQRFYKALVTDDPIKESWQWISGFSGIRNNDRKNAWGRFDDLVNELAAGVEAFKVIPEHVPNADFRMLEAKIPRQTPRFSGRTAINSNVRVDEQKLPEDNNSPLAFSMEGVNESPPSSLVPFYWVPGWNSVQAMYGYVDHPGGSVKGGDPGIRLIRQREQAEAIYFPVSPKKPVLPEDDWLFVPVYRLYGSEELSSAAATIATIIGEPFVCINAREAELSGLGTSGKAIVQTGDTRISVQIRIDNSISGRIAGLSVNFPGMRYIDLPVRGKLMREK